MILHEGRSTNILPLDIIFSCLHDKTTIGIAVCQWSTLNVLDCIIIREQVDYKTDALKEISKQ